MSPIIWLVPISILTILLLSIKTGLSSENESEKYTSPQQTNTPNNNWNW